MSKFPKIPVQIDRRTVYSTGVLVKTKSKQFLPDKSRLDSTYRMRAQSDLSVGSLCAILGNECFAFFDKMFEVLRKY